MADGQEEVLYKGVDYKHFNIKTLMSYLYFLKRKADSYSNYFGRLNQQKSYNWKKRL